MSSSRLFWNRMTVVFVFASILFVFAFWRKDRLAHGYRLVHQTETQLWNGTNQSVRLTELYHGTRQLGLVAKENQTPAFSISPTGRFAIFAAAGGGCGRLFLFDREAGKLRPVTELPDGPAPLKFSWRENSLALDVTRFTGETKSVVLRN